MIDFLKALAKRFGVHNMMVASAGVAFYGLLALAPTLLAVVSVYGLVTCDPDQIVEQVDSLAPEMGAEGKAVLTDMLTESAGAEEGGCALVDDGVASTQFIRDVATLVAGLLLAFWSASGAVQKLLQTVAVAYEAVESRPGWKVRLRSYAFTVFLVVGFVVLLAVLAVLPKIVDQLPLSDVAQVVVQIGTYPALAILFAVGLTILYRYGPDRSPRTPWRNLGALVGTGLFLLFAIALGLYSSVVGTIPASYGVIGSFAALMIFMQLTTIAVVVGAEVNAMREGTAEAGAGRTVESQATERETATVTVVEPVGFGKALAGLAALFVLGRGGGS